MICGRYLVVEGLEGAGKSSAIDGVCAWLREQGVSELVTTREPGGTPLAEAIRNLFKQPPNAENVAPATEVLLMYAARRQLLEAVIWPALARGAWVVADRHDWSTLAYQGGGRGLDDGLIMPIRAAALGDFRPDLTLYLDIPPEQGLERARGRGALDRIETQALDFFERVRSRYQQLAAADTHAVTIDASLPLAQVGQQLGAALASHWPRLQRASA
jgi:dTMP kinase